MGLKLGQAKFQPFTPRKTFSNRELNGQGVRKKCVFPAENCPHLGNGERYGRLIWKNGSTEYGRYGVFNMEERLIVT